MLGGVTEAIMALKLLVARDVTKAIMTFQLLVDRGVTEAIIQPKAILLR